MSFSDTPARDVVMVLELTLGNAVHCRNLERVVSGSDTSARVVRLAYDEQSWRRGLPVLGNWTVESSVRARHRVHRLLRERPPTAMYVHTGVPAGLLVDVMRRVPTVVSTDATPRNLDSVAAGYGHVVRSPAVERVKRAVTARVYTAAAAVVAQSEWTAKSVVEDYGVPAERVHVIAQGADLTTFRPRTAARDAGRPLRLLLVGADFTRKGGPVLLEAVGRLGAQVELDVVTREPVVDVPAGVRVHTGLDHRSPLLARLFQDADLFVLPSTSDAAPLVLGEALAAGLPIVASAVGAVPEMVVDGTTGRLVPPGSVDALVSAVRDLVEDEELRMAMGRRARALAEQRYDVQRNGERVLDLLHGVANGPRPS